MNDVKIIFGAVCAACFLTLGIAFTPIFTLVLGPPMNRINECKELEREGYLREECFDDFGFKPECKPKRAGRGEDGKD